MDKYRSKIAGDESLQISTWKVNDEKRDDPVWKVNVKHIPSGISNTFYHESQVNAYNHCLLTIEKRIIDLKIRFKPIYSNCKNMWALGLPCTLKIKGYEQTTYNKED